jgi:DNA repair exonuclease SbcCD nuclease subunit
MTENININMNVNVICIGDPHFKTDNIPEVEMFMEKLEKLCIEKKPNFICILGDILDTHERLHTLVLNKAYEFIIKMRNIAPTYLLVGNHDMINNQQFLNTNHWMNSLKECNNVYIVDKIKTLTLNNHKFIFVPYTYPGRFIEALETIEDKDNYNWKMVDCIFAHQEFYGCKMGAITSIEGDKWNENYSNIISGHIHSKQKIQKNIYYTGSAMQNAFGESEKNIIAYITFNNNENNNYELKEIDLELPRKKIIYKNIDELNNFDITKTNNNSIDDIKLSISGDYEQYKAFKKTKKYKELEDNGIKVVFKSKKKEILEKTNFIKNINDMITNEDETHFNIILKNIIDNEKNPYLLQTYEYIINNNIIDTSDIIYI